MVRRFAYLSLLLLLVSSQLAVALADKSDPRSLIAALSYNFAKYASWPENMSGKETIELCYFSDLLEGSFDLLKDKTIYDKPLKVKQLSSIEQSNMCHLVFVEKAERNLIQRLFVHLDNSPVLTVSDIAGFVDEGGMIEIVRKNNKFRFRVNQQKLDEAELKLSSQVLKLAVDVK